MTLGIIKKITETKLLSVGGDDSIVNTPKPIRAINPPRNPPIIPHLNRLLNLLKRIYFTLPKNRLLGDFFGAPQFKAYYNYGESRVHRDDEGKVGGDQET